MKTKIIPLYLIILLFCSCQEWLTIQPSSKMTQEEMFKTKTGFTDALNGCYALLAKAYDPSGLRMTKGVEYLACQWHVSGKTALEYYLSAHEYDVKVADDQLKSLFQPMYTILANLNPLIKELYAEEGILTEDDKNNYLGQALAMRAFVNFDLIRLWGPVPSQPTDGKKYLPYPTENTVDYHEYLSYEDFMKKLKKDMDEAEAHLKKYPNITVEVVHKRLDYYSMKALKARYYLWIGDKKQAGAYAKELINTKGAGGQIFFFLVTHDTPSGSVSLFEYENIASVMCETSVPASRNESMCSYSKYIHDEVFEGNRNDLRYRHWEDQLKIEEGNEKLGSMMILTKYKNLSPPTTPVTEENKNYKVLAPLIRLSEIYFIAMECLPLEEANKLYETFCLARGINIKQFTNKGELQECLLKEYRREFYGEGQQFYLYKRLFLKNMPNGIMPCTRQSYEPPIPYRELNLG